jgi:hypothetical protein
MPALSNHEGELLGVPVHIVSRAMKPIRHFLSGQQSILPWSDCLQVPSRHF